MSLDPVTAALIVSDAHQRHFRAMLSSDPGSLLALADEAAKQRNVRLAEPEIRAWAARLAADVGKAGD